MRVASEMKRKTGITEVAMFMGTASNHELLVQVELATSESRQAGPQDLIVIVAADNNEIAEKAAEEAIVSLTDSKVINDDDADYNPRTLDFALRQMPDANLVTISVPGEYAAREASKCLDKGLNVFLFSDNVSIVDEIKLKQKALVKGCLVMGPDCGTAYINDTPLGFANVVKKGRIGCIAASGTGLQAVACYLDQLGEGISHALGVGGRDLSQEVGGLMTLRCLELLDDDPATEIIVLISKPPAPQLIDKINTACAQMQKPVIAYFQGDRCDQKHFTQCESLDDAARRTFCLLNNLPMQAVPFTEPKDVQLKLTSIGKQQENRQILGLYTGGTLAKETQLHFSRTIADASGNGSEKAGFTVIDLGDDKYTLGRPHPMIAPDSRIEILEQYAVKEDFKNCGVLLVDIVLGYGSHHDPASVLVEGVSAVKEKYKCSFEVVVALIATAADPQGTNDQQGILETAGMHVFRINSEAARFAEILVKPVNIKRYF